MKAQIYIEDMKRRNALRGMNPDHVPDNQQRYSEHELHSQLIQYEDVISVVQLFLDQFLSSMSSHPLLVGINNCEGYLLSFNGTPSILEAANHLGIREGVRFDSESGPSSIDACLQCKEPVVLIGEDHYHKALHGLACYSVPLKGAESEILGAITFMTEASEAHDYLLALLISVSESVERELLLRQRNGQLHILNYALLQTPHYGVLITDEQGRVVQCNERMQQFWATGKSGHLVRVGDRMTECKEWGGKFSEVLEQQKDCIGAELRRIEDGSERHYLLDIVPVHDEEGQLIRAVATLRDITEMKRTEEMLRNTEKLVFAGQLAVGIAHEIRNPLSTVKGMLQITASAMPTDRYELMMSELNRMNGIVSEFLMLGRPQTAVRNAESCLELIDEALDIFEFQALMGKVEIRRTYIKGLMLSCDRNQLKQAFLNVLKNACDAMPDGGVIVVEADESAGWQRIRFTDNGEGMPEEVLRRLGEPFYTTRSDGNGLGMMIVNRIVASHEGQLHVTSHPGAGTTVEIRLPALRAEEEDGHA